MCIYCIPPAYSGVVYLVVSLPVNLIVSLVPNRYIFPNPYCTPHTYTLAIPGLFMCVCVYVLGWWRRRSTACLITGNVNNYSSCPNTRTELGQRV